MSTYRVWATLTSLVGFALVLTSAGTPILVAAADRSQQLQPTEVNVTNDPTHRWGEPEVVANPKNPDNLVYFVMRDMLTYACERAADPNCVIKDRREAGLVNVAGWIDAKIFVSFDRGRTWTSREFPCCAAGHDDLTSKGDPMVTATKDGTFYIGWDSMHLAGASISGNSAQGIYGGIAVAKSTDGGKTWSVPVLTGTPVDRPWLEADLATGRLYGVSSGAMGPGATADPNTPQGTINDRWLVASNDGVHWTMPHRLGGTDGSNQFSGAQGSRISAAHGVLAATFRATQDSACAFFVGGKAPCVIFETTTDDGVNWSRHRVSAPDDSTGTVLMAADPSKRDRFAIAVLNAGSNAFMVYTTSDRGATWRGPVTVSEDGTKTLQRPWLAYSPNGVLGLMWRANELGPGPTYPYTVWAAISKNGGARFSRPRQITTAPSPAPDSSFLGSDDVSFISLTRDNAIIAWADWRPGERSGYVSTVTFGAFKY